ncbi:ABC transporter substrate-binding protein/permease [Paucilactobacillus suebicus]|uniref:ABC-type amino acid transport system, permease and periplasmic component n=1 Tax=Paucilactobacillus suebicus DSM 5007 = KCTC 3549 TaxID=1423807 RepID=A0A0R1W4J2_9LACO|nr:ABC transporter substrate-binding protein/permease [Paucilactobacillus suebicus]KRM12415.1 ABC-type amino acid transport system, permease and periplasmic component [Paucilactobacillus suebicus DSM 5007 = KCTC 3549]
MKKFCKLLALSLLSLMMIMPALTTSVSAAQNSSSSSSVSSQSSSSTSGSSSTSSSAVTTSSDDSLARIKAKGEIVLGTSPDYPPYEFTSNGKVVGMDIQIARKIAKDMGVKLVIKKMSFDSLLVALESGKVDMVISGVNPTAKRAKSVDFSNSYYKAGQYILINKTDKGVYTSRNSFANKTLGAQTGSLPYNLAKDQVKDAKVKGMDQVSDLVIALKSHKVDGVVVDEPTAKAYASNDKNVVAINGKFNLGSSQTNDVVAVQKGSTSLRNQINTSIAEIKKENLIPGYLKKAGSYMKVNTNNTSMWHYWHYFAIGVEYTIGISAISVICGFILGVILAFMRLAKKIKVLRWIATAYVEFVRGTPLMVQILFVYFGLGVIVNIPAVVSGIIAVSLNSGAYVCEVIRGGILSVDKGQDEAARSLGLNSHDTMFSVILPQALKNIWPALGNEFVSLIKETSIVSIIGVSDMIYQLKIVQADTYRGVIPIVITMILYFILTFAISRILRHYEVKMAKK